MPEFAQSMGSIAPGISCIWTSHPRVAQHTSLSRLKAIYAPHIWARSAGFGFRCSVASTAMAKVHDA